MPVKSYIVIPCEGEKENLVQTLNNISGCKTSEATNKDIILLITDTENEKEEDQLKSTIESIHCLKFIAMVSGYSTP